MDNAPAVRVKDKLERYELDKLVWSNYVLGKLTIPETVNVCNEDLKKRFEDNPPFGKVEAIDVSSYIEKIHREIKKKADSTLQEKVDIVFNIVDQLQNIAIQVKDDMDIVRGRARKYLEESDVDSSIDQTAALAAENKYFKWDDAFHKDILAFKDIAQLLASVQGKISTNITLNVVDEKFKIILETVRDSQVIPNNMKRALLAEIKDKIDQARKDLISMPTIKEAKVINAKPVLPPLDIE